MDLLEENVLIKNLWSKVLNLYFSVLDAISKPGDTQLDSRGPKYQPHFCFCFLEGEGKVDYQNRIAHHISHPLTNS